MNLTPLIPAPTNPDASTVANRQEQLEETSVPTSGSENRKGMAVLLQQELDLRHSVEGILMGINWPHSAEIDRTLREQLVRLSANVAVLNQRYMISSANDSETRQDSTFSEQAGATKAAEIASLPDLIAQYRAVLATIASLIVEGTDRARGKMILTQVALSHEEMAASLTKFLDESPAFEHDSLTDKVADAPTRGESRWENEGGSPPPGTVPPI